MRNPWTKKNPFMSMWLSGAHSVIGAARGRAMAEAKRQSSTMMTKGIKDLTAMYTDALLPRPPRKKKTR